MICMMVINQTTLTRLVFLLFCQISAELLPVLSVSLNNSLIQIKILIMICGLNVHWDRPVSGHWSASVILSGCSDRRAAVDRPALSPRLSITHSLSLKAPWLRWTLNQTLHLSC